MIRTLITLLFTLLTHKTVQACELTPPSPGTISIPSGTSTQYINKFVLGSGCSTSETISHDLEILGFSGTGVNKNYMYSNAQI